MRISHVSFRLAAAACVAVCLCAAAAAQARAFGAVSVRQVKNWNPYRDYAYLQIDPTRFYWPNTTLSDVIKWAWDLNRFQLSQQPSWLFHDHFTIQATVAAPATGKQMQAMMQRYLADTLRMRFHFASTPEETLDLKVAKGGFKLKPVPPPPPGVGGHRGDPQTLDDFLFALEGNQKRVVFNRTGISGYFRINAALGRKGFMLRRGPDGKPEETLSDILEDKLGLTLKPSRANVSVLVVDAIQHPADR